MPESVVGQPELERCLSAAVAAARDAAGLIASDGNRQVVADLQRDVKIAADRNLHEFFARRLTEVTPYPVVSEEDVSSGWSLDDDRCRWVVDPLDGSVNFLRGIPFCCMSIALCRRLEPLLGVVYDFGRDEMFTGLPGTGAWLNGRPVRVAGAERAAAAVLCTGFPVGTDFSTGALGTFVQRIQAFKKIRLFGSAALSLAYVASGRADAYAEQDIAFWDVAAGLALVTAAGGSIDCRPGKGPHRLKVAAASPALLAEAFGGPARQGQHP